MSLTSTMFTGVSGLLSNAEGINVIGNNLANVNTTGFKGSRALFADMLSTNYGNNSQVGRGSFLQSVDDIYSQGSLETTTSVTDLAVQGNSFFVLKSPASASLTSQSEGILSRAGSFSVDENGYLVNPDGYQVVDTNGDAVQFFNSGTSPATAGDFAAVSKVDSDGSITYVDKLGTTYYYTSSNTVGIPTGTATAAQVAALNRIAVIIPSNPDGLDKMGGSLYRVTVHAGVPTTGFSIADNTANGVSEKIYSNSLEQSNVDMASEFVKMILTQRAYSANSKTIMTADEMTQEVLNIKR